MNGERADMTESIRSITIMKIWAIRSLCALILVVPVTTLRAQKRGENHYGGFGITASLSLPTGTFANLRDADGGYAKNGYAIGAEYSLNRKIPMGFILSAMMARNGVTTSGVEATSGDFVFASSTTWQTIWLLGGLHVQFGLSRETQGFLTIQGGEVFAASPSFDITIRGQNGTVGSYNGSSFGYALGAGIVKSHIMFGLRYYAGEPKYTIFLPGPYGLQYTLEGTQSVSMVLLTTGVMFSI